MTLRHRAGPAPAGAVFLDRDGTIIDEVGYLDRVERLLKVLGMVNVAPGFDRTPEVITGCSDLFVDIFGDAGRHARSAVGMAELPGGIAVEIELIARLK